MATFHAGECDTQARVGVREKMAELGPRLIRDFMPDQHREFFAQLPFVVVGAIDGAGQPWAAALARPPGFIESPSPRCLVVRAVPHAHSPLKDALTAGKPVALLGIAPHTRRRNRANGRIETVTGEAFTVAVQQSFGNCPKYIQARQPRYVDTAGPSATLVHRAALLSPAARQLIRHADTFFIATCHPAEPHASTSPHGADVSHRGGKAGFVRVDDDDTLLVPDFAGNHFFNTLGNIAVNPRAGLLFIDFATGDAVHVAADAEIIWQGSELESFAGAERLLRFQVREMKHVKADLPLRWGETQYSPFLDGTGTWGNPGEQ